MRKIIVWAGFLFCLGVSLVLSAGRQETAKDATLEATIAIDSSKPTSYEIPRTVFVTFLEPIGNSIYGGLWAELLQNPRFEDNLWSAGTVQKMIHDEPQLARASELGLPLPREPLDAKQGNRYEPRWNDAANSCAGVGVTELLFFDFWRVARVHDEGRNGVPLGYHTGKTFPASVLSASPFCPHRMR